MYVYTLTINDCKQRNKRMLKMKFAWFHKAVGSPHPVPDKAAWPLKASHTMPVHTERFLWNFAWIYPNHCSLKCKLSLVLRSFLTAFIFKFYIFHWIESYEILKWWLLFMLKSNYFVIALFSVFKTWGMRTYFHGIAHRTQRIVVHIH